MSRLYSNSRTLSKNKIRRTSHKVGSTSTAITQAPKTNNLVTTTKSVDLIAAWTKDDTIDASIILSPEQFTGLQIWFADNSRNEIGGWFSLKPETREVSRMFHTDTGTGAHVNFSPERLSIVVQEMAKTGDKVCGTWHTHPGMGIFWSGTDDAMMIASLEEDLVFLPTVDSTFIVFDPPNMLTRRIIAQGNVNNTSYNDGSVYISGSSKPLPSKRKASTPVSAYTTYAGYDWKEDYDDLWEAYTGASYSRSYGKPIVVPAKVTDITVTEFMTALTEENTFVLLQLIRNMSADDVYSLLGQQGVVEKISRLTGINL